MSADLLRNDQKTYILGLLIAAGTVDESSFLINIPFSQWGIRPDQQAAISRNILTRIRKRFEDAYGLEIDFEIGNKNTWRIFPLVHSKSKIDTIKSDLQMLGLPQDGTLLDSANLTTVSKLLSGTALEHFLVGIFDARASLTHSHRRFVDSAPIVSIEVPGKSMNFKFVVQLCSMMTDLGSTTDQILYNHPNFHSSRDSDYKNWKKGFKIRLLAGSFIEKHSFALSAKTLDVAELADLQLANVQTPCKSRTISAGSRTIHMSQSDPNLPPEIRGRIFLHYHQVCAAMGCPHAPIASIEQMVSTSRDHISVLPLLMKGEISSISNKFSEVCERYFPETNRIETDISVGDSVGKWSNYGYSEAKSAHAFLVAPFLRGKRPRGSADLIIANHASNVITAVELGNCPSEDKPPVLLINRELDRAVIMSSISGQANKRLIEKDLTIAGIEVSLRPRET